MSYINVGARYAETDAPVPTKKALREAIKADPESVRFYGTSLFTPFSGTAGQMAFGAKLSVCGPDPERKRNWFATVGRNAEGKIVVS